MNHENSIEIRRVDNNTYDVFHGKQWATWTRLRQNRHTTYHVAGERVGKPFLKDMHDILAPNMPINYAQRLEVTLDNCHNLAQH